MKLVYTCIPGCYEIEFTAHQDARGSFINTSSVSRFRELGLETNFVETCHSISHANVLRGMHLQLPPACQAKLIYCLSGSVMDVALDVRTGAFAVFELSAERHTAAYLPRGMAHGFYVRQAPAVLCYHMTPERAPALETGIAWNSFGAPWPVETPLVSAKDAALPPLSEFHARENL
jgi:dTDP-4-dehydrorhamnose 3,5-epimerase